MTSAKPDSVSFEQLLANLVQRNVIESIGELKLEVAELTRLVRAALSEQAALRAPEQEWLSVQAVARIVGAHDDTVKSWIQRGELKASRKGRKYQIRRRDLDEFMMSQPVGPSDASIVDRVFEQMMAKRRSSKPGAEDGVRLSAAP